MLAANQSSAMPALILGEDWRVVARACGANRRSQPNGTFHEASRYPGVVAGSLVRSAKKAPGMTFKTDGRCGRQGGQAPRNPAVRGECDDAVDELRRNHLPARRNPQSVRRPRAPVDGLVADLRHAQKRGPGGRK